MARNTRYESLGYSLFAAFHRRGLLNNLGAYGDLLLDTRWRKLSLSKKARWLDVAREVGQRVDAAVERAILYEREAHAAQASTREASEVDDFLDAVIAASEAASPGFAAKGDDAYRQRVTVTQAPMPSCPVCGAPEGEPCREVQQPSACVGSVHTRRMLTPTAAPVESPLDTAIAKAQAAAAQKAAEAAQDEQAARDLPAVRERVQARLVAADIDNVEVLIPGDVVGARDDSYVYVFASAQNDKGQIILSCIWVSTPRIELAILRYVLGAA